MRTKKITEASVIASIYVILTLISNVFGLASGVVQVRLSEVLTVLPCFTSSAIAGLTAGCLIANIITGSALWDIVFGTMATLIGAVGTYALRKHKMLAPLPPVLSNTIIIPFVLIYTYGADKTLPFLMISVGIGEVISAWILGIFFIKYIEKHNLTASLFK